MVWVPIFLEVNGELNMSEQERKAVSEVATEEEIRDGLVRGLWADYQRPETSQSEKIKIAGLIERLTRDVELEDEDEF
jgi:hypothetical protein